jgi:hypothetical protein
MEAPCGVLPAGLAACTTEFEDDLDGSALGGHCWQVRQHPTPSLKTMWMAGPLGVLSVCPTASTTEVEDDFIGGPPRGCYQQVR